ncbi:MAG: hypothetical protein L6R39_004593 [Caloplaca ligustica]|nr:MAG: hypothetical protein L6R39_004593 [Caloplaca ligustica]
MPTPRQLTPKRPKLSLQTSTVSTLPVGNKSRTALNNISSAVDSPTTSRNTHENAFEAPPSTPVSAKPHAEEAFARLRQSEGLSPHTAPSSSSASTVSSGPTSPFANTAPYTLALGARSILRNSPLPRRHLVNMSNRPSKRMFQPIKRVSFHESPVEMIPTPVFLDSDISTDEAGTETTSTGEKPAASESKPLDKSDGVPSRRKRRSRDWIWRPVDEEASPVQANSTSPLPTPAPPAKENPPVDSETVGNPLRHIRSSEPIQVRLK